MCALLIGGLGHTPLSVRVPIFSLSNTVVLAKSYFVSSACCNGTVGIALMPLRCL